MNEPAHYYPVPMNTVTRYSGLQLPHIQPSQLRHHMSRYHGSLMHSNGKISKIRKIHPSKDKLAVLSHVFEKTPHVDHSRRTELAAALGMTTAQVKNWFYNRRVKHKKDITKASVVPTISECGCSTSVDHYNQSH